MMDIPSDSSKAKRNVVLTGFGPFGVHSVNNSWECAKLLKESDLELEVNVNLIIHEIPVIYEAAEKIVKKLWEDYDPVLVIHVGVHSGDSVIIEKRAHNKGYIRNDVNQCLPPDGTCPTGTDDVIYTQLSLNDLKTSEMLLSTDAGRYLCEYTYYLSLNTDSKRTLFVHIPPCTSCVSKEVIVFQLKKIIETCLNQLLDKENNLSNQI